MRCPGGPPCKVLLLVLLNKYLHCRERDAVLLRDGGRVRVANKSHDWAEEIENVNVKALKGYLISD